jgi:hypothetical protein
MSGMHCSTAQTYVAVMGNSTNDHNFIGPVEEYEDYLDRPIFYLDAQNPGDAPIHLFVPTQALSDHNALYIPRVRPYSNCNRFIFARSSLLVSSDVRHLNPDTKTFYMIPWDHRWHNAESQTDSEHSKFCVGWPGLPQNEDDLFFFNSMGSPDSYE